MKRTIEISASFTGTIATGSYENSKPHYSAKETFESESEEDFESICEDTEEFIADRQKELHAICYNQFKHQAELCYSDRIAKQYKHIRFYEGKDQMKYPSVTSIIGWDSDYRIPQDELTQYGSRGTIIHKQVEIFLRTGEWRKPKEIPEIYPDIVIVKQGNLGLEVDNVDFQAFYKEYPFEVIELEKTCLNHDKKYAGRLDIKCLIKSSNKGKWDKVEGILYDVPTILDVKTGALDKNTGMKQQTAYAKCEEDVQQIGLIHLNKETKQGYSKPVIETNLEKYWALFLADRDKFRNRFGI